MIKAERGYIEGSLARKPVYDVYARNPVLKTKKGNKVKNKAKFRLVIYIIVLFSLAFVLLYRYTAITELNYKIVSTDKKLKEIQDSNSRLKVEIEKSTDLEYIRRAAEEKLGMQKPDRAQIVYVAVPREDITVLSPKYTRDVSDGSNVFAVIINRVLEFINLIS